MIGQVFGPGPYWNAVSDGYWVMMPPLPAGSHQLRYYAHLKIPEINLDLEFDDHQSRRRTLEACRDRCPAARHDVFAGNLDDLDLRL